MAFAISLKHFLGALFVLGVAVFVGFNLGSRSLKGDKLEKEGADYGSHANALKEAQKEIQRLSKELVLAHNKIASLTQKEMPIRKRTALMVTSLTKRLKNPKSSLVDRKGRSDQSNFKQGSSPKPKTHREEIQRAIQALQEHNPKLILTKDIIERFRLVFVDFDEDKSGTLDESE